MCEGYGSADRARTLRSRRTAHRLRVPRAHGGSASRPVHETRVDRSKVSRATPAHDGTPLRPSVPNRALWSANSRARSSTMPRPPARIDGPRLLLASSAEPRVVGRCWCARAPTTPNPPRAPTHPTPSIGCPRTRCRTRLVAMLLAAFAHPIPRGHERAHFSQPGAEPHVCWRAAWRARSSTTPVYIRAHQPPWIGCPCIRRPTARGRAGACGVRSAARPA
jgi:hypothetical protein